MNHEALRRAKLKLLRDQLTEDAATKPAWDALQALETATADLETRRVALTDSGLHTPAGVHAQLKEFRDKHATALRAATEALQKSAEGLLSTAQASVALPEDHQRILTHWQSLPAAQRNAALAKAMTGRDPELAATLAHKSSERYSGLTPSSLQILRSRFADADAGDNVQRLATHQIAAEMISEALATMEAT